MSNNETISLSKGCFVYKHQKKQADNSQKAKENKSWNKRKELYKSIWTRIESEIENIQESAHDSITNDIVEFVKRGDSSKKHMEIPTCAVVLGVNTPDHTQFFNLISRKLEPLTTYVTVLNSKDCMNIGSMVQKTVTSFVKYNECDDSSRLTKYDYTFSLLLSWYMSKFCAEQSPQKFRSPRKKRKLKESNIKNPPLVIILEEFETFNPNVLENFILICNCYINKLPLFLIFGVATAMTTVHSSLTQKASSCLAIESFYSLSPVNYLSQVLQIIMNPSLPFKMGPNVFRLTVDYVLYHDFSVTNLKRLIKFCVFEHFYENDESILCSEINSFTENVQKLSKTELDEIAKLSSMKSYLDNLNAHRRTPKKQNIQRIVIESLENIHLNAQQIDSLMPCLHGLMKDIPGQPFGKQIRELYLLILERDISMTEEFERAFKLFSMLSKEEMEKSLKNFINLLDEQNNMQEMETLIKVKKDIQEYLKKFKNLPENPPVDEEEKAKSVLLNWGQMTSRSQLKEKLKDLVAQKKETPQELWRSDLINYLKKIFKMLKSPSNLPLHEVLYFDDVTAVERHMLPSPRTALQNALRNPHSYLRCSCCKLSNLDEIVSSLPDICIVYKLHLECGRLINLFDWFQSFCSIVQKNKQNRTKNVKIKEDSILLARFMNCVTELEMLGFIKPTQRRTDHVMRLTWGY